jgi:hypothetical protein
MKVQLEAAEDIWLQVNIPDKVSIDSFLERVEQLEHVIARDKKSSTNHQLPSLETSKKPAKKAEGVDDRIAHLEKSTQKIIDLLDGLQQ